MLEREAARDLAERDHLVTAMGGGTLPDPENAAALGRTGVILLLDASLAAIPGTSEEGLVRDGYAGGAGQQQCGDRH